MPQKKHKPGEIVGKLRPVDVFFFHKADRLAKRFVRSA
jgi:hypothetical protein